MYSKRTLSPQRAGKSPGIESRKLLPTQSSRKRQAQLQTEKKDQPESLFSDLTDEELLELFRVVDSDGGGTLSRDELKDVMVSISNF